jgi:hypothetical protein
MLRIRYVCSTLVPQTVYAATDLALIIYLKVIPDFRMRRDVRNPALSLLVLVLCILSKCESLRELEFFPVPSRLSQKLAWD